MPVYGGVQEIAFDDNYVYVRSTGLGTHTMGPWYDDIYTRNTMFASFPGNQAILYRFSQTTGDFHLDQHPHAHRRLVSELPLLISVPDHGISNEQHSA